MTISSIQKASPLGHLISNDFPKESLKTSFSSSIGQAQEKPLTEAGLFSPPILLIIDLMNETYLIGQSFLLSAADEIKFYSDSLSKKMAENIATLQKAAQRAQESGVWSALQKVGGCILSALNLFIGASIYSSSPTLGSTLIASGILSAANLAMTELRGWDLVAGKISNNEDLKTKITFWSPIALHCLSGALSAVSGSSILYDPNLLSSALPFDIENFTNYYTGITTAGKGITDAGFSWTKADLSLIQNAILSDTFLQDSLIAWIQDFTKLLEYGWEQAKNIITINSELRM
ncbi:MAG: hypothetical protein V4489_05295 [Chlamydiota bacterium]